MDARARGNWDPSMQSDSVCKPFRESSELISDQQEVPVSMSELGKSGLVIRRDCRI